MSWLKKNWRTIAGAACGVGAGAVTAFVNPALGLAVGAACTAYFGHSATKAKQLVDQALAVLSPEDRRKMAEKQQKLP